MIADSTFTHRRRKDHSSLFVLLSALLHALLFGVLMLFPPVRKAVFGEAPEPPKPELRVEGERLAELVEQVRDINEEELLADVLELEQIKQEMEQIRQAKLDEFEPFEQKQAAEAPQVAQDAIDVALQAQQDALDALKHAASDASVTESAVSHAQLRQADAGAAQKEATSRLELTELTQTAQKQAEANRLQATATEAAKAAADARAQADAAARAQGKTEEELAKAEKDLANMTDKAQKAQASAQSKAKQAADAQAKAEQAASEAAEAAEAAKAAADAVAAAEGKADKAAKQAKDAAKRKADGQAKEASKAAESAKRAASDAAKASAAADHADAERAKREATVQAKRDAAAAAAQATADAAKATQAKVADAAKAQEAALDAQRQAKAAMQAESAARAADADTAKPADTDAQAPTTTQANAFAMNLPELYNHARELESKIADDLHEVRAMELAMITGVTLSQAKANTDVPRTQRPDLDAASFESEVTTGSAFKHQAEQIETARREAESMVNASSNMLQSAAALLRKGEEGSSVALDQIEADAALAAKIAQAAHELAGGQAADLAALMKGHADAASAPAPPAPAHAGGGTNRPEEGGAGAGVPEVRGVQPPDLKDISKGQPARKFVSSPRDQPITGGWVFIDSWYTIGPFDNPGRVNIHRQFPPQTVIDLDAVYQGKRGQPIRWQHTQTTEPMVVPDNGEPYGIWYAYTELHFEQAADLWIAVGSDDRSDLWINDVKVWSSSDTLKSWRIGEGLRRVHFKQGRNRVLCRIENGHHGMGFSVCVNTAAP